MLSLILQYKSEAERALDAGVYLNKVLDMPIRDKIARSKYISEDQLSKIDEISKELTEETNKLIAEGGVLDA